MAYQFESRVRYSEVDEKVCLRLASVIDYFQDCSTFQSEECGNGLNALKKKGMAWMILSWQVQILRLPRLGEKIVSQTWPYSFKAFYGYRNYTLQTPEGEYLAKANSVWALIDLETGHPARVTQEMMTGYELEPRLEMPEFPRKVLEPDEMTRQETFQVTRAQLDSNHHVNNGQYVHMAQAYLPDGFETGVLRVEYRRQAKLGDVILPMVHSENGSYTVSLCDQMEKPYAVLIFTEK